MNVDNERSAVGHEENRGSKHADSSSSFAEPLEERPAKMNLRGAKQLWRFFSAAIITVTSIKRDVIKEMERR